MLNFHLISIFPDGVDSYINESIIKRAIEAKKIALKKYNPRDFSKTKYNKKARPNGRNHSVGRVDDKPYAGGPGMVMTVQPIVDAVKKATHQKPGAFGRVGLRPKVIILSPRGKQFDNNEAKKLAKLKDIVLISGRYEGIDGRVKKILKATEYSIGPYTLTGGELPALVMIDAIARQVPGVLGKFESLEDERLTTGEVYTRPEVFEHNGKKYKVPPVLLSGDPKKIEEWRKDK